MTAKMTRIPTTTAMVTPTIRPTFRFCFEGPVLAVAESVGPPAPVALGPDVAVDELPSGSDLKQRMIGTSKPGINQAYSGIQYIQCG